MKEIRELSLLLFFLLTVIKTSAQQKTFYASADCSTSEIQPDINQNGTSLTVGTADNYKYFSYIKFNLGNLEENITITKATLFLNNINIFGLSKAKISECINDWNENTITFNSPAYANGDRPSYIFDIKNGTNSIDVTESIIEWYDKSTPNYGFLIQSQNGSNNEFASFYPRENGNSVAPRLVVEFEEADPSLCFEENVKDFGNVQVGSNPIPKSFTFTVENCGGGNLIGSIETNTSWLIVSSSSINLEESQTQEITVTAETANLPVGDYSSKITISTNGGNTSWNAAVVSIFESDNTCPSIPLNLVPTDGTTIYLPGMLNFSWDCSDADGDSLEYTLYINDGNQWNVFELTTKSISFRFTEEGDKEVFQWYLKASDGICEVESNTVEFTIDYSPPDINITPIYNTVYSSVLTKNVLNKETGANNNFSAEHLNTFSKENSNTNNLLSAKNKFIEFYKYDTGADNFKLADINFDVLKTNVPFTVNLTDTKKLTIVNERIESRNEREYSWFGKIVNDQYSNVIFTVKNDNLYGVLISNDEKYYIKPIGDGLHILLKENISNIQYDYQNDYVIAPNQLSESNSVNKFSSIDNVDNGSVVDVIVFYTDQVSNLYSDVGQAIQFSIDYANQAYINSNIFTKLNLVNISKVNYINVDSGTDLSRLHDKNDGYLDEIHNIRDEYNADVVLLGWLGNDGTAGRAYINSDESLAFGVTNFGNSTLAHEVGHIFGAHHNPEQDNNYDYSYGHGYLDMKEKGFSTIMAYDNKGCPNCIRIPYFSNPNVKYGDEPTGTETLHNNARVLNARAFEVANFRYSGVKTDNSFTIFNKGNAQTLILSSILPNKSWLNLNNIPVMPFNMQGGEYHILTYDIDWAQITDEETASIEVKSNDPDEPSVIVTVNAIKSGTTLVDKNSTLVPSYVLYQNYPNPFNPITTIKYSILQTSYVKITIYDLLGRKLKNLIDGVKQPGKYEIQFNGNDLTSGIYFYTLQAGKFVDTKKLILLK